MSKQRPSSPAAVSIPDAGTRRVVAGPRLVLAHFDAGIFDLDGVLTRTARLHAVAWKAAFDALSQALGDAPAPFDPVGDYRRYVDGKPRLEGARAYIAARGIVLPEGASDDPPGTGTLRALCALKNRSFLQALSQHGAEVFDSSVQFVRKIRAFGLRTGLVSSSRNGRAILAAAGLPGLFDIVVDGEDSRVLQLAGKPLPDAFLEAARRLEVLPRRAFVVEDALAGVEAGRRGGFGCVVGLDRADQAAALRARGADIVVADLSDLETGA